MVTNHKKPEAINELSKRITIAKFLDQFPTYLKELLDTNNVALSYVIHTTAEVPATLTALIALKTCSATHTNMMDELISYTPHDGPSFGSDNARVYTLLSSTLLGTSAMASISRYQRIRNGREAFLSLITHNMGSSKWEKTVELAENVLRSRIWNGKMHDTQLKSILDVIRKPTTI